MGKVEKVEDSHITLISYFIRNLAKEGIITRAQQTQALQHLDKKMNKIKKKKIHSE